MDQKFYYINPSTPVHPTVTVLAHNLRHHRQLDGIDVWSPVGLREPDNCERQWTAIGVTHDWDFNELLVLVSDTRLAYQNTDGEVIEFAELNSPITSIVADGWWLDVTTEAGFHQWYFGNETYDYVDRNGWSHFAFELDELADFESTVPDRTLSTDYPDSSTPLRDADVRAVKADLTKAYNEVVTQSEASGAYCAPALVCYRLIGRDERVIFTSPPVLLGPADTARLTAPISVDSVDRRTLSAYIVSARGWKTRLTGSRPLSALEASAISRIEILASPQFHPFDPKETPGLDLVCRPGSKEMLRITLPGAASSLSSATPLSSKRRLDSALGLKLAKVATIQGPFAEGDVLDLPVTLSPNKDRAVQAKHSPSLLQSISPPHSFSARTVASAADTVVWGNLTAHRYHGHPVDLFTARRAGPGAWHSAIAVRFSSGSEQVVATAEGKQGAPLTLNPLLSYPSPDAVAMTVIVSAAGEVRRTTVPLTPDPSGSMSYYIHDSFAPFELTGRAESFVVPAEHLVPRPMPSYVAASHMGSADVPFALASVGAASVKDVCPASRSQSSWDFSRSRFSVISSGGVFTLTSSASALSLNLVDRRLVTATVQAADRLLAVAGGSLVEVGVARLRTILDDFPADLMAFDPLRRELWASSRNVKGSRVLCLDTMRQYTRDETVTAPYSAVQPPGYAIIDSGLCNFSTPERVPPSVYIRWDNDFVLSHDAAYRRLRGLTLDLTSSAVTSGSLSLRRHTTSDSESSPSITLSLNGRVAAPLRLAVPALPMRRAYVSLQGRFAPDTIISSLTLDIAKQ